jgi:hypothetical protein
MKRKKSRFKDNENGDAFREYFPRADDRCHALIIQCKERFGYLPHLVLNKEIRPKARTPLAAVSGDLSLGFYAV